MGQSVQIPNKSHFKLNEVCGITGVKPYVLRFWESEFPEISPEVSNDGQKIYSHQDIEAVALVKKLLFEEKLTIEKAKMELSLVYRPQEEPVIQQQPEKAPDPQKGGLLLQAQDLEDLKLAKVKLEGLVARTQELKGQLVLN